MLDKKKLIKAIHLVGFYFSRLFYINSNFEIKKVLYP